MGKKIFTFYAENFCLSKPVYFFLSSNKMSVVKAGFHKMPRRIANRVDPDKTASSEAVWSGSAMFV